MYWVIEFNWYAKQLKLISNVSFNGNSKCKATQKMISFVNKGDSKRVDHSLSAPQAYTFDGIKMRKHCAKTEMPAHTMIYSVHSIIIINSAAGYKQCARLCRLFYIIFGQMVNELAA